MKYVLALDQGTSSSRALLFDRSGAPIASAQQEFRQHFPQPGWVEHDPDEIWASQAAVAREVCDKAGATPSDIAALGLTNQRETTVLWDRKTGRPIARALVWQDRRTAAACDQLKADGSESWIRRKTGLLADPYFSATKIQWMLKHVPNARALARAGRLAFGTVDSWLIWNLTGGALHVTDASNASRTLLYSLKSGTWDSELLELFDIPPSILPQIVDSSGVLGHTSLLGSPIPIAGVAGDQQAALFGQMCHRPGAAKSTYGTGAFLLMHCGDRPVMSRKRLLATVAWRIGGTTEFALEGSIFVAGAVVQWLRDGLGLIRSSAEVEALAAQVPDSGGVIVVPAFAGLGAPHWDSHARGAIRGLTRGTTAAHIARACLEGIAFQVADVLDAMRHDAQLNLRELRVDGGACANDLLMQFQADLLRVPVVRPQVLETTALGAAYLAGLAVGFWKGRAELARQWLEDRRFRPTRSTTRTAALRSAWDEAVASVRSPRRLTRR